MATAQLKKLHTALVDTTKGYQEAVKDADDAPSAALFRAMLALRERDHGQIHAELQRAGQTADDDGSLMGTVHETVIGIRSAITGLGTNALGSFVMGEEQILGQYDAAIDEAGAGTTLAELLSRQRATLRDRVAQMKQMAD